VLKEEFERAKKQAEIEIQQGKIEAENIKEAGQRRRRKDKKEFT